MSFPWAACEYLEAPAYGYVKHTGVYPKDTAKFSCKKGHKLVGDEVRTCLYGGYWSGDQPKCVPSKLNGLQCNIMHYIYNMMH